MAKNEKTLSVGELQKQREELQNDLDKVQKQMQNIENMKVQLTAQGNALSGAIQQCDVFLNLLGESNPDSSIPSQDDSAVQTALS
jgi:chromosome segregation ATPase